MVLKMNFINWDFVYIFDYQTVIIMETKKKLSKEERLERALRISRQLLENKRETQQQMKEDMFNPESSLFKSFIKLREENARKGHPYAL
jgi:hypothetical protein